MNVHIQSILERLNRLDIKMRYAIFAVVVLLIGSIDYFLLLRLQFNALNKMDSEFKTLSADTTRVKGDVQRIEDIKKGVVDMRAKLQELNAKVRTVQEASSVFQDISSVANASHVNIDQLSPTKEGREVLATLPDAKYYALPIVISAHSGYHMFGRFLGSLESGNILFLLRDLRMDSGDKNAATVGIQATLKIVLVDTTLEPKK